VPYPDALLIHSATLTSRRQNFILGYDTGTAAFTVGKTLTGATSHATATIIGIPGTAITDSDGAAIYTVPANTLLLHSITGTFQDNEVLVDNGTVPGAALVDGAVSEAFDIFGQLIYTDINVTTACRFSPQGTQIKGSPLQVTTVDMVVFPGTVSVEMGDKVTAAQTGFTGDYTISKKPKPTYEAAMPVVSHWTCELAKAGGA
jgi:hypothetical protein